jgi:hypothetical protein
MNPGEVVKKPAEKGQDNPYYSAINKKQLIDNLPSTIRLYPSLPFRATE